MQIKELFIQRYGPISERRCPFRPGFNLVFGSNEDGKTLTVDALVKILLGENIKERDFEAIGRVKENPTGYAILETEQGVEHKLPEDGGWQELTGLSAGDCRNIFVIRNSNLAIAGEKDYYASITDRLTGLRSGEIEKTIEILREEAKITPGGAVRNVEGEKVKKRLQDARKLADKGEQLLSELQEEGFEKIEQEQVTCRDSLSAINARLESLEQARLREKYEACSAALEKLRQAVQESLTLEVFNEEDERNWYSAAREVERLEKVKADYLKEIEENEKEGLDLDRQIEEGEAELERMEGQRRLVEEELRPALISFDARKADAAAHRSKNRLYTLTAAASTSLLTLSLLGALFQPHLLFFTAAALFAVPAVLSWFFLYRQAGGEAARVKELERMKNLLAGQGLEVSGLDQIRRVVRDLTLDYRDRAAKLDVLRNKKENLVRETDKVRGKLMPRCKKELEEAVETIDAIKRKSGQENLDGYGEKLKQRQKTEKTVEQQEGILKSMLGGAPEDGQWAAATWEKAVRELAVYKGKAPGVNYDENKVTSLKQARQEKQEQIEELGKRMDVFAKKLQEIEREANSLLQRETLDYLYCHGTADLEGIRDELISFVDNYNRTRNNALAAIDIFQDIAGEEIARVAELFGPESAVTPLFEKITGGLYREVFFGSREEDIFVRRRDQAVLTADRLSGGAYDQLYLSIRLALGEKLLQGEKGFFIMDDPFIKSDSTRLERQLTAILDFCSQGWQVIFFSAKEEVQKTLKKQIKTGGVNLVTIKSLFK